MLCTQTQKSARERRQMKNYVQEHKNGRNMRRNGDEVSIM